MAKLSVKFTKGIGTELTLDASAGKKALKEAAEYVKEEIRKAGKAAGVYRTGDTLNALTVKGPTGTSKLTAVVTYTGAHSGKKAGRRNAEVAFVNEYGKKGMNARPFNRTGAKNAEEKAVEIIEKAFSGE